MTAPKVRPLFCPKCGGTEFTAANLCRPCHRARVKAYRETPAGQASYARGKPRRSATNKAWYEAHKEQVVARAADDRAAGRLTDAAKDAIVYKTKYPERLAEAVQRYLSTEKGMLWRWSSSCADKLRNRSVERLTARRLRELWHAQAGTCLITFVPLDIKTKGHSLDAPSLDRIDPTLGYVLGNVRLITRQANGARLMGSDDDLYYFCKDVLAHRDKLNL